MTKIKNSVESLEDNIEAYLGNKTKKKKRQKNFKETIGNK